MIYDVPDEFGWKYYYISFVTIQNKNTRSTVNDYLWLIINAVAMFVIVLTLLMKRLLIYNIIMQLAADTRHSRDKSVSTCEHITCLCYA